MTDHPAAIAERERIALWHDRMAAWFRNSSDNPSIEVLARIHDESANCIRRGDHITQSGE